MRVFVLLFQRRTVPSVIPELILAFVDPDLYSLNGGSRHVRVEATQTVLPGGQVGERLTDRVGVKFGLLGRYI